MKKFKGAVKKVKQIQDKVKSIESKVKKIGEFADAPMKGIGGFVGGKLGSKKLGTTLGSLVGRVTGTGDYQIISNTLAKRPFSNNGDSVPTFQRFAHGVRVQHREYLGDLVASSSAGAFSVQSFSLNPGLFSSFPWLSSFASQFDEWKPNGVVVCYKAMSSFYSGTTSLGTVIIASDYDVLDSTYATKREMENSEFACSCNAAMDLYHPIECKVSERPSQLFYTRTGDVPDGDNKRFYDLCNFEIATQGCVANQVCGEIWITYDITLYKPQLYGGILGNSILYAGWIGTSASVGSNLSTGFTLDAQSPIQDITWAASVVTFPEKYVGATWKISIWVKGTAATTTNSVFTPAGGMVTNYSPLGSLTITSSAAAGQENWFFCDCYKQIASPGVASTLTFGSVTWPSSPSLACIVIEQTNPSFVT